MYNFIIVYLWNESHEDQHTHTRYDVRMVLYDKLMAEKRRGVFVVRSTQHGNSTASAHTTVLKIWVVKDHTSN